MSINIERIKKNQYKLFFVLPAFIFVATFFLVPNIINFYYAFTNWSPFNPEIIFRGWDNFIELTEKGILWKSLGVTLKYALFVGILQNFIALSLAVALEKPSKFNAIIRTTIFIPVVLSPLAAGYIWKALYHPDGPINAVLSIVTRTDISFPFLGNLTWTIFFVALTHAWKAFGITMLVYIAGLKTVPNELVEAAEVEGSTPLSTLLRIKIPLIGPAFTFNIVITLIATLSAFGMILVMTQGGPVRTTAVMNYMVFEQFGALRWGYATAITLVKFVVISSLAFPLIYFLRKREVEY